MCGLTQLDLPADSSPPPFFFQPPPDGRGGLLGLKDEEAPLFFHEGFGGTSSRSGASSAFARDRAGAASECSPASECSLSGPSRMTASMVSFSAERDERR